jgi:hypothetical protein
VDCDGSAASERAKKYAGRKEPGGRLASFFIDHSPCLKQTSSPPPLQSITKDPSEKKNPAKGLRTKQKMPSE